MKKETKNIVEDIMKEIQDNSTVTPEEIKENDGNKIPPGIYVGSISSDESGQESIIIRSGGKSFKLGDLV